MRDIKAGEPFTTDNIRVIRPGDGLAPKYFAALLGQTARQDYRRGEPLSFPW